MNIPWLDTEHPIFPEPALALDSPNGLLAAGGNLAVETLLDAYRHGIFPWYSESEPILWWSPEPRLVLRPSELHISRSLHKSLRHQTLVVSLNKKFSEVIEACAQARKNDTGTWIGDAMKKAYVALHQAGYAHSIEVSVADELVGGLYGICIGRMFFGESMFSHQTDASKTALVYLCRYLEEHDIPLIDCQVKTEHLLSLGAAEMNRADFLGKVQELQLKKPQEPIWQAQSRLESLL